MKKMTKGEVRTHIVLARKAIKRTDADIRHGRAHDLADDIRSAIADLCAIEDAIDDGGLDHWKTTCVAVKEGGVTCDVPTTNGDPLCQGHAGWFHHRQTCSREHRPTGWCRP